jgi:hypothetical protein
VAFKNPEDKIEKTPKQRIGIPKQQYRKWNNVGFKND